MPAIAAFRQDTWTRQDPRLPKDWPESTPERHRSHAARTDHACRQGLLEIDVLAAKASALTLDDLPPICHIRFPVMHQYEAEASYDAIGRIVFTLSKDLPGLALPRKAINGDTAPSVAEHAPSIRDT